MLCSDLFWDSRIELDCSLSGICPASGKSESPNNLG